MIRTIITWIKREWKPLVLLSLAVGIVYANSLPNVFISDDLAIYNNLPKSSIASSLSQPNIITRTLLYIIIHKLAEFLSGFDVQDLVAFLAQKVDQ